MIPVRRFTFPGNGVPYECLITLCAAGPMKVGVDDKNRVRVFSSLGIESSRVVSVSQKHSRTVFVVDSAADLPSSTQGDGVLTMNPSLVPCVTVADCMPLWLCHERVPCFGVLHSGWKGTGILLDALEMARRHWGADPGGFKVIIGPHIRNCCYTVDDERARYFMNTFSSDSARLDTTLKSQGSRWPWRLSLAAVNRQICLDAGIPEDAILDTGLCTACNSEFGSHRREGPGLFTYMAALIRHCAH